MHEMPGTVSRCARPKLLKVAVATIGDAPPQLKMQGKRTTIVAEGEAIHVDEDISRGTVQPQGKRDEKQVGILGESVGGRTAGEGAAHKVS